MSNSQLLTWAEVDLKAIRHNLREIRKLSSRNPFDLPTRRHLPRHHFDPSQILTVIKADGYGHGMEAVAKLLQKEGIGFLSVSNVSEGARLRAAGIKTPILLLESILPEFVPDILKYKLIPTVCNLEIAQELNSYAQKKKIRLSIHVKVDTGMGRFGVWFLDAFDFINQLSKLSNISIEGIYTHFPSADTDASFTRQQMKRLYDIVIRLDKEALVIPYVHAANSMGLAGYRTHILNIARPGLMLYGLYPATSLKKEIRLKSALSVYSKVIFIKKIQPGRSISYGRTFIAKKPMTVATIPIGYSDGYPRSLSNKAVVLIDGQYCRILGRVTMDQIIVDVSGIRNLRLGAKVVVLGKDKSKSIDADQLAKLADTISYEIVCNLGNRLPRIYKNN